MKRFDGKKFLITGGTSGIGLATAQQIIEEGGQVMVTGRTDHHIDEAKKQLGGNSTVLKNDASKLEDIKTLKEKVKSTFGTLDGAFLNAGFGTFAPIEDLTAEHIDGMFDVNVKGVALHLASLKPMLNEGSSVVVTSSVAPYLGLSSGSMYSATKGAVSAMVRSFAFDLAPNNIRVNAVCPGPIDTNFFGSSGMKEEDINAMKEGIEAQVPLSRFGRSEEVAQVVTFLLSSQSSYVTGSEYMVDGGMTLR